jgi:hypothetical protein
VIILVKPVRVMTIAVEEDEEGYHAFLIGGVGGASDTSISGAVSKLMVQTKQEENVKFHAIVSANKDAENAEVATVAVVDLKNFYVTGAFRMAATPERLMEFAIWLLNAAQSAKKAKLTVARLSIEKGGERHGKS